MKMSLVPAAVAAVALSAGVLGMAQPASAQFAGKMPKSQHIYVHPGDMQGYQVHGLCGFASATKNGPVSVREWQDRIQVRVADKASTKTRTYRFDYKTCVGYSEGTHLLRVTVVGTSA